MFKKLKHKIMNKFETLKVILDKTPGELESEEKAFRIEQAKINADQELFDLKKEISNQQKNINDSLRAEPFSLAKVYQEKTKLELLERKLTEMSEIHKQLFI